MRAVPVLAAFAAAVLLASCDLPDGQDSSGDGEVAGCGKAAGAGARVRLRYRVESTPSAPGTFAETAATVCRRLARLGLHAVEVRQAGHELHVTTPRSLEPDTRGALTPGGVLLLDWEPNVLGDRGPDSPYSGSTALFDAVEAASGMQPLAEATDAATDPALPPAEADLRNDAFGRRYYLFGSDRRPIAGPAANPGSFATARTAGSRVLEVPQGIVVMADGRSSPWPGARERYFVVEDDPELTRAHIEDPRPESGRQTRAAVVTFGFTEQGRTAFAALTRRIAQRGAAAGLDPSAAPQRLAIALDDRIVALPRVDFRENPDGLDGRTGAQVSSVDTRRRARRLALLLRAPPLPANVVPLGPA